MSVQHAAWTQHHARTAEQCDIAARNSRGVDCACDIDVAAVCNEAHIIGEDRQTAAERKIADGGADFEVAGKALCSPHEAGGINSAAGFKDESSTYIVSLCNHPATEAQLAQSHHQHDPTTL